MSPNSRARDDREGVLNDFRQPPSPRSTFEALDKSDISELSATTIGGMTCDELVRLIHVASLPDMLHGDLDQHLPFYDHPALIRLAHLAQRCCRTREQRSLRKEVE